MRGSLMLTAAGSCVLFACLGEEPRPADLKVWTPPTADTPLHPVTIARPSSAAALNTAATEISGTPAAIACATCHAAGSGAAFAARAGTQANYHQHVDIKHGGLTCASCHVPGAPGKLHRAAGQQFPLVESLELCSQCHGPQRRNYEHGAHGGMRGYWDRQRGPRQRNDCIVCHAAHAPAYPKVTPVLGPIDRFAAPRLRPGSLVEQRYGEGKTHE